MHLPQLLVRIGTPPLPLLEDPQPQAAHHSGRGGGNRGDEEDVNPRKVCLFRLPADDPYLERKIYGALGRYGIIDDVHVVGKLQKVIT